MGSIQTPGHSIQTHNVWFFHTIIAGAKPARYVNIPPQRFIAYKRNGRTKTGPPTDDQQ